LNASGRSAICSAVRRIVVLSCLVAATSLLTPAVRQASAGGFRCGNRLVSGGELIDQVFTRCGEPSFRDFSTEYVSFETAPGIFVTKEVAIETWTYNRGPREFVRYLKFRDGRLDRISEGDYGY
jgi:hypothetical protein